MRRVHWQEAEGTYAPAAARAPQHQLWATPGHRADQDAPPLVITFDDPVLDLVVRLDESVAETIIRFELPHLCDDRPHEDPRLEAWLVRWLDGDGPDDGGPLTLEASTLSTLQALSAEQPEVCPLLCSQLRRFEKALEEWLSNWPQVEPPRRGLFRGAADGSAGPSAEALEVELHAALALLRGTGGLSAVSTEPLPVPPVRAAVVEHFRQVAFGWIFKLDSLYGLEVLEQPARAAQIGDGAGARLSLLRWGTDDMAELLHCAFFRPMEPSLLQLARRWQSQARADDREPGDGTEASAETTILQGLLWELLPREEMPVASCEADARTEAGISSSQFEPEALAGKAAMKEFTPTQGAGIEDTKDAMRILGLTFERVPRRSDCPTAAYEEVITFHSEQQSGSGIRHLWNAAGEEQVVGAARQMVASKVAMSSKSGRYLLMMNMIDNGRYRLDLRVVSGTESEGAHFFEVGLVADPSAGVCFKPGGPGAGRPPLPNEESALAAPFFRLVAVLEMLREGVRLAVEVDFAAATAHVRNLPPLACAHPLEPTPLGPWLAERAKVNVLQARPPGELDCQLFRDHAQHLQDLITRGTLDGELAGTVLSDNGARCAYNPFAVAPDMPEEYHFYIVVPAGLEVEIY